METQTAPATTVQPTTFAPVLDAILQRLLTDRPENADRLYKAAALVTTGSIERTATPFLFLVYSQSTPDGCYRVQRGACNCPDAQRRDPFTCKHAESVAMFVQLERAAAEADRLDADAPIALELTPEAYALLDQLGEACEMPAQCSRCGQEPAVATHCDYLGAACIGRELFGPDPDAA